MTFQDVQRIIADLPALQGKDLKSSLRELIRTDNRLLKSFYGGFEAGLVAHVVLELKKAGLLEELSYTTKFYVEVSRTMIRLPAIQIQGE